MASSDNIPPSPGSSDDVTQNSPVYDLGLDNDPPTDTSKNDLTVMANDLCSDLDMAVGSSGPGVVTLDPYVPPVLGTTGAVPKQVKTLGHQSVKSGGINVKKRVLMCSNVDLCTDYLTLHNSVRACGTVQRIKMCLDTDKQSYNAYITFVDYESAEAACSILNERPIFGNKLSTKVMSIDNISEEEFDYIPKMESSNRIIPKRKPILTWHVAEYKEDKENYILASECIENRVGRIPQGNMKRYGKKILIKAGNETQASMLTNFSPSEEGNIRTITPHNSFNTSRGVVYSKDLFELDEDEILKRCPEDVFQVRKLKGTNNALLMTFSKTYLPEYIMINHSRIKVKIFLQRPKQCFICFNYGHVSGNCTNQKRCYVCSGELNPTHECNNIRFCFICEGSHSPNSKQCSRYRLEQEILEVAHNEKISLGSAKRKIMGANRTSESSYASIISKMKTPNAPNMIGKPHKKGNANEATARGNNENAKVVVNSQELLKEPGSLPKSSSSSSLGNKDTTSVNSDTRKASGKEAKPTVLENKRYRSKSTTDDDGFVTPSNKKRSKPTSPKNNMDIDMTNSFSSLEDTTEVVQDKPEQKRLAVEKKSEESKTESVRPKNPPVEKSYVGSSTTEEVKIQRERQAPTSDNKPQTSNTPKPSRLPKLSTSNKPGHILKSDKPNINR